MTRHSDSQSAPEGAIFSGDRPMPRSGGTSAAAPQLKHLWEALARQRGTSELSGRIFHIGPSTVGHSALMLALETDVAQHPRPQRGPARCTPPRPNDSTDTFFDFGHRGALRIDSGHIDEAAFRLRFGHPEGYQGYGDHGLLGGGDDTTAGARTGIVMDDAWQ